MDNFNEFVSKISDIKIANIQPGDTIIFKVKRNLSLSDKDLVCKNFKSLFPDNEVIIIGENTDIEIVRPN